MNWKHLILEEALEQIVQASTSRPQLIFKHSTRCSISTVAKSRLERNWTLENVDTWYLDLIAYRGVSNMIEARFEVRHESPQALLIKDGKAVYHASHNAISASDIAKHVS